MKDEFSDRHQAIKLRLAGQSVEVICQTLERSREWFHLWWRRYQAMGAAGLYDVTRARQSTALISPELERTILTIRKRLESTYHPQTRYALIGASAIQAELKALNIRSVPCARTIERALQRNGVTLPRVRLARFLPSHVYPAPQAQDSNQLHQVDLVGPIYLKGQKQRYYIFVCKDIFDGAVCLKLGRSRKSEAVLEFLGECWKILGRPKQVQFDNAREYLGWGPAARYLSRMIRLCLRFEVEPIFIPPARPQHNGSVENFNGWFQPRLFQRHFTCVSALKRELQRLQETVNTQHVQRRLGGLTPDQYRRRKKLQKLPPRFVVSTNTLPVAAGRVTFIRQVTIHGKILLLSQTFSVGKRLKHQYVKVVLDTQRAQLTVYVKGRVFKRWAYPFLKH
ncbi:MAG: DDE-type integrase/transposase/recombinase [Chloroflexi bacterium]|nr:DDE-type integrase/transposase/recombinase [Chloroflexota bacterium]